MAERRHDDVDDVDDGRSIKESTGPKPSSRLESCSTTVEVVVGPSGTIFPT